MKQRFLIRRLKCSNCGRLHRELPDCLVPYKHYASEVISGVLDGSSLRRMTIPQIIPAK